MTQTGEALLAKPGAWRDEPWDHHGPVAKVGERIFAFLWADTVGVKCGRSKDEAQWLRDAHPGTVEPMAYIGRFGWNTVQLDALDVEELHELVDASYDDVVARLPRSQRPSDPR